MNLKKGLIKIMEQQVKTSDKNCLVIDENDNVAIALTDLKIGDMCHVVRENKVITIQVRENIPFGHKFALDHFEKDESVYKYGEEIGKTSEQVLQGSWIHTHNMYCDRGLKE